MNTQSDGVKEEGWRAAVHFTRKYGLPTFHQKYIFLLGNYGRTG
jgi:hypothetical protein